MRSLAFGLLLLTGTVSSSSWADQLQCRAGNPSVCVTPTVSVNNGSIENYYTVPLGFGLIAGTSRGVILGGTGRHEVNPYEHQGALSCNFIGTGSDPFHTGSVTGYCRQNAIRIRR